MMELYIFAAYIIGLGISGGAFWSIGFNDPICGDGGVFLFSVILWPVVMPIWASWRLTIFTIDKIKA